MSAVRFAGMRTLKNVVSDWILIITIESERLVRELTPSTDPAYTWKTVRQK